MDQQNSCQSLSLLEIAWAILGRGVGIAASFTAAGFFLASFMFEMLNSSFKNEQYGNTAILAISSYVCFSSIMRTGLQLKTCQR